jgi:hypothetical protein
MWISRVESARVALRPMEWWRRGLPLLNKLIVVNPQLC